MAKTKGLEAIKSGYIACRSVHFLVDDHDITLFSRNLST